MHDPTLAALPVRAMEVLRTPRLACPLAIGLLAVLFMLYGAVLHPWLLNWGSTPEEQHMALLGDDPRKAPRDYLTRAVSIKAEPSRVWPWLLQVGQDRAGFYSNTWLENLFGGDIHNSSQIKPEWQERAVGDRIPMAGEQGTALLGDVTKLTVRILETEQVIGDIPGRLFSSDSRMERVGCWSASHWTSRSAGACSGHWSGIPCTSSWSSA